MNSTSETFIVDTHALVWRLRNDPKLSSRVHDIFDAAERRETSLIVPTIVLAELMSISERRFPDISFERAMRIVEEVIHASIVPFDLPVVLAARRLSPDIELHDRIIAATALVNGGPVITRDRAFGGAVETFW